LFAFWTLLTNTLHANGIAVLPDLSLRTGPFWLVFHFCGLNFEFCPLAVFGFFGATLPLIWYAVS
jgi:hypothetical protein